MTAPTSPRVLDSPQSGAAPKVRTAPTTDASALEDLLARGYRDDVARHPRRRPLRWWVLVFRADGVVVAHELARRRGPDTWLRRSRAPFHLVERPGEQADVASTTGPAGLRGYSAVVLVEHAPTEPEPDPHRLLAAGNACWRSATAAGYDAVLVTAPAAVPGDDGPVVGVGLCRTGADGAL